VFRATQQFVTYRDERRSAARLAHPDGYIWDLIYDIVSERHGTMSSVEADCDAGDKDASARAGKEAKAARTSETAQTWTLSKASARGHRYRLLLQGIDVGCSADRVLNDTARGAQELARDGVSRRRQPMSRHTDWAYVPVKPAIPRPCGAEKVSAAVGFHTKMLLDLLPLMSRMRSWYPLLYLDDKCRRCGAAAEVWNHVLNCAEIMAETRKEADDCVFSAMDDILAKADAKWLSRHWWSFGFGDFLRHDEWILNYTPAGWPAALAQSAGVPIRAAKDAIAAGMAACRDVLAEKIWKPRCAATVEWESRQFPPITAERKKNYRMNPPVVDLTRTDDNEQSLGEIVNSVGSSRGRSRRSKQQQLRKTAYEANMLLLRRYGLITRADDMVLETGAGVSPLGFSSLATMAAPFS
jgi:hypothetical protein